MSSAGEEEEFSIPQRKEHVHDLPVKHKVVFDCDESSSTVEKRDAQDDGGLGL